MGVVDTTSYKVQAIFEAQDKASKTMEAIERSAAKAASAIESLKSRLTGVAAGYLGFSALKKGLIDYNKELEDSRVKIAGLISMFTGAPIEKSFERSGRMVERFQEMAKKSSLSTKDLVQWAELLQRPLLNAGVSLNKMEGLAFGAANAAKAFGLEAGNAAFDIEQMIMGKVGARDRFAGAMLGMKDSSGLKSIDREKFNKLNQADRMKEIEARLGSKAIKDLAAKQGEGTFTGVTSTLKDTFEITMGRIGKPLFTAITKEVKSWNDWLEKNSKAIDKIGDKVAGMLVTGFQTVKSAVAFIVDHADTLISIAKAYAVLKAGSMVGGFVQGLGGAAMGGVGGLRGLLSQSFHGPQKARDSIDPFTGEYSHTASKKGNRLRGIADNAGLLGGALAGGYGLGTMLGLDKVGQDLSQSFALITGKTDAATVKYDKMIKAMGIFDQALKDTAASVAAADKDRGRGTKAFTNLQGAIDFDKQQLNIIEDIEKGRKGSFKTSPLGDWEKEQRRLYESVGLGEKADTLIGSSSQRQYEAYQLKNRISKNERASSLISSVGSDLPVTMAIGLMTKAQRESIDKLEAIRIITEKNLHRIQQGLPLLDVNQVKELLLKDALDPFKTTTKVNQNITNNIKVEVSAKDPDRWMTELDAKVARKISAPSQARGSVITRGGR